MKKKTIPLDVLRIVEPIVLRNADVIKVQPFPNCHYCLVEVQDGSPFFFRLYDDGKKVVDHMKLGQHVIEMSPGSQRAMASLVSLRPSLQSVVEGLEQWLKMIREYNETASVHDDPFFKTYYDHYFNEFKSVDDDAEYAPFNPAQQNRIEQALLEVGQIVQEDSAAFGEEQTSAVVQEIQEIQRDLPTSTKNQIMRRISAACARIYQRSKPTAQKVWDKLLSQRLDKLIEAGIKFVPKLLDQMNS